MSCDWGCMMARRVEVPAILLQATRARLFYTLRSSPGLRLKELGSSVNAPTSTLLWHLGKLRSAGLVSVRKTPRGPTYELAQSTETRLAEAVRILQSVPARELVLELLRRPGQHLGQAAKSIGAPRSRYWRSIGQLEVAGLVQARRPNPTQRRRVLYPTDLANAAAKTMNQREWAILRANLTRRQPSPSD